LGRLASLPLGAVLTSAKGEQLIVIEKSLLLSRSYSSSRDFFNTLFESRTRDPLRVKSFRDFYDAFKEKRDPPKAQGDAAPRPDSADNLRLIEADQIDVLLDEGEIRPLSASFSLAFPAVPDAVQDAVLRKPLSARQVILGPPGSGKTTTLLRRLDFQISRETLEANEGPILDKLDGLGRSPHAFNWLLLVSNDLTRKYIKKSLTDLFIPGLNDNVKTWEELRRELASDYFRILASDGFKLSPFKDALTKVAKDDSIGWYLSFLEFHQRRFYASLKGPAVFLSILSEPNLAQVGRGLLDLISKAQGKNLTWFSLALDQYRETIFDAIEERQNFILDEIKKAFERQTSLDPDFVSSLLAAALGDWPRRNKGPERFKGAAFRFYFEAVLAKAAEEYGVRALLKTSPAAKSAAWLGQSRFPEPEILKAIAENRRVVKRLKKFKVDSPSFLNAYFGTIVSDYLLFRRTDQLWYTLDSCRSNLVEGPEVDLMLLAFLEAGAGLFKAHVPSGGSCGLNFWSMRSHAYLLKNQILVDEISDYSPIQLKCLDYLAHPAYKSITGAGDLELRLSQWGLKSFDELEWAWPKSETVELTVNYRQARHLAQLTQYLRESSDQRFTDDYFHASGGKPVWAENLSNCDKTALWLCQRLEEIRERTKQLPSVAVVVGSPSEEALLADALNSKQIKASTFNSGGLGQAGEVLVLSVERLRGLEFEVVFFVNLDDADLAVDNGLLTRQLLYLAASRAVTYFGLGFKKSAPPEFENLKFQAVPNWAQSRFDAEEFDEVPLIEDLDSDHESRAAL
jgi:hypothetical protein